MIDSVEAGMGRYMYHFATARQDLLDINVNKVPTDSTDKSLLRSDNRDRPTHGRHRSAQPVDEAYNEVIGQVRSSAT